MQLMLKNKRLAFAALATPQAIGDGEPAYGGRLIISPNDPDVKVIDDAIAAVAKDKWKDKADDILSSIGASNPELRACVSGISQWLHNPGTGTTGGPIGVIDGRQSMRTG